MKKKIPLKRSKLGFELELTLLDSSGFPAPKADMIIRELKKHYPELACDKENGKHVIELHSFPSIKVQNTALNLLENLHKAIEICERKNLMIFPHGTYPGKFDLKIRKGKRYGLVSKIVGKKKVEQFHPLINGFHCHYTLPRGVFDHKKMFLKPLLGPKVKQTLIDSYNLLIAMDPALMTLTQSSPFVNGKYYAKDSKNALWRDGVYFKVKEVHTKFREYYELQPYKFTLIDLIRYLERYDRRWRNAMLKAGATKKETKKKKLLDFFWNPVKINKVGTLEERGLDSNQPKYLIGTSVLIKYALRAVHQDFMRVVPTDVGVKEAFKIEGNSVLIPPHSYVREKLQVLSAHKGLESREIEQYTKRFLRFTKKCCHVRYEPIVKHVLNLVNRKKTVSDMIIRKAKKKGYRTKDTLPPKIAAELALKSAKQLAKDLPKTTEQVRKLEEGIESYF